MWYLLDLESGLGQQMAADDIWDIYKWHVAWPNEPYTYHISSPGPWWPSRLVDHL